MSEAVRIDRDAFRRGVEDVMTLAPLREAVRSAATGVFSKRESKSTTASPTSVVKNDRPNERHNTSK